MIVRGSVAGLTEYPEYRTVISILMNKHDDPFVIVHLIFRRKSKSRTKATSNKEAKDEK